MKYTVKFKLKCVQMYRKGKWMETPEGVSQQDFRDDIKYWDKREKMQGNKGLRDKSTQTNWTFVQKMTIIEDIKKTGVSMNEYAISHAMNSSTIGRWMKAYKAHGEDGLK